jgi:hypothetical protein
MLLSVTERIVLSKPTDLLQGTLGSSDPQSDRAAALHGWAIAQRIHQISGEVLQVAQSVQFPVHTVTPDNV